MEAKLSLLQRPPELRLPIFQSKSNNLPSYRLILLSSRSREFSERFYRNRIRGTVKKWRLRLQEMSTCQCSDENFVVHVVKEGETLTSISKRYGVSVYRIAAANKNVADIDLVYYGQHMNIPSPDKSSQVGERSWAANFKLPERLMGPLNASNELLHPKNFGTLYSRLVPQVYPLNSRARNVGYFLVLVPLVAFCIRCVAGAIQARVTKELKEPELELHSPGGGRWKSKLGDAWEPDLKSVESNLDSAELKEIRSEDKGEDEAEISDEEESRAYTKLERDYKEFLSRCGMSDFGYWRGGSSW